VGTDFYDEKKAKEIRKYIQEENAVWVGMGDMAECSTRRSVGAGIYQQVIIPKEQIKYLREFLKPIANKCIGMVNGNHEDRIFKDDGVDILDIICYELEIPYCGCEIFGSIVKEKKAYTFYGVHSRMGNKTAGLALNASERDIEKMLGNFQILMRAHAHKNAVQISEYFEIDTRNNTILSRPRVILMTGHYTNRRDSYVAQKPQRPEPKGTIALELDLRIHKDFIVKPIYL